MVNAISPRFSISLAAFLGIAVVLFAAPVFAQKNESNKAAYEASVLPFDEGEKKRYDLKIVHPYSMPLKTIQKSMASLVYKKKDLFNVQSGRVFSADLIQRLAPLIAKNFARANKDQRISFKVVDSAGKIHTRGDTFLTPEGLHWRLTAVKRERWGIEDFSVSGEPWKLVLQKDQTYKQRYWRGSRKVAQDIGAWVICKNILPEKSRVMREPVQEKPRRVDKSSTRPDANEIRDRLQTLEQLRKENAVTEEEYKTKRKEILREF